ncbi:DNA polymerase III subunit chi [Sulfurivirga sp.]|uniref:DNA polymerase III subunit chi n=1 Tax=Sulfurivirga sp. TaxID=2614236 RepID=UPI0025E19FC1|nr:DNA polymerase III subunit chi [Sulfurivirga sp.]
MRLEFHVLDTTAPRARLAHLIRLLERLWPEHPCDVRLPDGDAARRLDLQLWRLAPEAFLPHALGEEAPQAHIRLWGETVPAHGTVLVNLHPQLCAHWRGYEHVIELLDQSPELLERGRDRWRAYRAAGVTPTLIKPEEATA